MSQDLIAQLKQLKNGEVKPRQEWLDNNRALLLSQIKNTVTPEAQKMNFDNIWNTMSLFVPRAWVFNVVRPIAVLLVVAIVATSGWVASVDASYNTLPGDFLYPAKRAGEKTQVAVAGMIGSKKTETILHSEFAKRRATETKQLVASKDPAKQEKVKESIQDLKKEIANVNQKLEEIKVASTNNAVSADVVKDVKQDTEQITNTLQEVKAALLVTSNINDTSSTKENAVAINEAKDLAKDVSVKAVEVIVTKHLEGDKSVTAEEVKQEINNTLQSATTDAQQSKQSVAGVQAVVTAAKIEAKDLAALPATSATSTTALNLKISEVASVTNNAAAANKTVTDNVDKKVNEAVTALSKGDLTTVMIKLTEANTATKEAEKISDQMVNNVQQLVPVAPLIAATDIKKEVVDVKDIKVIIDTSTLTTAPVIKVIIPTTTSIKPEIKIN
ncbi:MAG: DUF5667 domain-containing protein [Candidatus Magasanikbacteria bacterium]